ncbi:DUF4738 domain-containing protein [Bacteroides sp.]|uniref:DUF4738 domain-containing protein n=1 Tax=Bacteroides sp. TaxID=29523 RepID=UPI001B5F75D3|nr:DUF4738 domain-containing protein [Bacteroides sp.]MBP6065137.1 DUF4738 domain-containing protein [Bacteroides sp.]MBP6068481.1 DUF4738 domain-containing protein [Bacteroides sp.]MBP6936169.1 DUF4738 domain-containing protein [Bacteroides sp.]MBP9506570.1 DUF4738 domain-containing protein [Bacteroides sp.]MBP9586295.1 DUF4738 domain-containing protein [Bacteroides sp.]
MNKYIAVLLVILLTACHSGKQQNSIQPDEDIHAKSSLQGIWIDSETDSPLMRIKGDTIYYSDPKNIPVYFKIIKDTLYTYGNELNRYQIDQQTEQVFWFHSYPDNIVKLYKSEEPNDSLAFSVKMLEEMPIYNEKTEKDSVIIYNGTRYRAYVYINPSKIKVIKTSYSEEGIGMDNIYYDNVMHICVYEGRKSLFASDITKQMFEHVIPTDFLTQSILSDMNFTGIDSKGYHYQAMLCIPESAVCNIANLTISFEGKLSITTAK